MTARELAEKLLGLEDPDIPVVVIQEQLGHLVRFADPQGYFMKITVHKEEANCSLVPGDYEVLVLEPLLHGPKDFGEEKPS